MRPSVRATITPVSICALVSPFNAVRIACPSGAQDTMIAPPGERGSGAPAGKWVPLGPNRAPPAATAAGGVVAAPVGWVVSSGVAVSVEPSVEPSVGVPVGVPVGLPVGVGVAVLPKGEGEVEPFANAELGELDRDAGDEHEFNALTVDDTASTTNARRLIRPG